MKKRHLSFDLEKDLQELARGSEKSFRRLYDYYYPMIYRFTRYFVPAGSDCDEVVSEVFCLFWQNRQHICQARKVEAYLYIVCRNEAWRLLKQKDKYRNISIDDMPVELSLHSESIENNLIEKELFETYKKAVETLPERCKLIFLMVREEKLKYKEISGILGISEGTIEHQMNIAIKKIVEIVKTRYPSLNRDLKIRNK